MQVMKKITLILVTGGGKITCPRCTAMSKRSGEQCKKPALKTSRDPVPELVPAFSRNFCQLLDCAIARALISASTENASMETELGSHVPTFLSLSTK
jgi:hypothetical protein